MSFNGLNTPFQYLVNWSTEGPGAYYIPPNKTQDHQPIWEIQDPEETQPNLSRLSKEAEGHKRPLLVVRLLIFTLSAKFFRTFLPFSPGIRNSTNCGFSFHRKFKVKVDSAIFPGIPKRLKSPSAVFGILS